MKTTRIDRTAVAVLLLSTVGCARSEASSIGSSYEPEPEVPARVTTNVELVVRPDLVRIPFVIQVADADLPRALGTLQTATDELNRRLSEASTGSASARMRGTATEAIGEKGAERLAKVDGVIEARLGDGDFWARARLVAALEKTLLDASAKGLGTRSKISLSYSAPESALRDAESRRAELLSLWVKRVREFVEAAQTKSAPLVVVDCTPPAKVSQTSISLEEVGLALEINCKVDVVRPTAAPAR